MIDIQETKKVNSAMVEILKQSLADPRIMLSMEGYLVTSDSSQNPHTSIEVFLNSMDLRGYTVMGEILSKEFGFGYSIDSFVIPANHAVHERLRAVFHISRKEGSEQQ